MISYRRIPTRCLNVTHFFEYSPVEIRSYVNDCVRQSLASGMSRIDLGSTVQLPKRASSPHLSEIFLYADPAAVEQGISLSKYGLNMAPA